MLLDKCPGAAFLRGAQTIKEKNCPECGGLIEIFSRDTHVICTCGFIAYNDTQSCILWCAHARECVGDEVFENYMAAKEAAAAMRTG